jgi:hypothetical protein
MRGWSVDEACGFLRQELLLKDDSWARANGVDGKKLEALAEGQHLQQLQVELPHYHNVLR